ncbi:hypothetical protein DERF_005789 [Dermatophagoides farinae]|uniref:Uncharacterized protein n=1 Tax=Dermatophagoides farinae TaxID=6954 RepID=A0A922L6J0_DERFA|nr:hypothetical protein DERF_005789 [Dermatophagoides farinae]
MVKQQQITITKKNLIQSEIEILFRILFLKKQTNSFESSTIANKYKHHLHNYLSVCLFGRWIFDRYRNNKITMECDEICVKCLPQAATIVMLLSSMLYIVLFEDDKILFFRNYLDIYYHSLIFSFKFVVLVFDVYDFTTASKLSLMGDKRRHSIVMNGLTKAKNGIFVGLGSFKIIPNPHRSELDKHYGIGQTSRIEIKSLTLPLDCPVEGTLYF